MTNQISLRRKVLSYGLVCAIAGASVLQSRVPVALAQDAAPAAAPAGEPQTRGLFLVALVPVFAQMVGQVGSTMINSMFEANKAAAAAAAEKKAAAAAPAPPPAADKPMVAPDRLAVDGKYFAGVAYATMVVPPQGGEPQRVDPANYRFRTGDKFMVRYVANMPGRVDITNINPRGKEVKLGSWPVAAGQQINLPERGNFEFTGSSGDEGLRIAFTPCTSGNATRDIAIDAPVTVNYRALLPVCDGQAPQSRDIAVNFEDGMGYAVSQLDDRELNRKITDSRVFMIRLQHASATTADADTRGWIVTPDEASQPATRQLVPSASDPEGPKIEVRVPGEVKEVTMPVKIDVAFEPRDGAKIDFKTLKITYLKMFNIDITDRMKPYLTPTGIFSDNAKLPPGDHSIEISLQDDSGRRTVERFNFKVLK